MNQTKKRLKIIKLAISITDIETIQLQILKLGLLRTDEKIKEIISALRLENYAQAQALITTYIETYTDEVIQRTFQEKEQILAEKEYAVIEEFDLFITKEEHKELSKNIDFDFFLPTDTEPSKKNNTFTDFNDLLQIDPNDVLSDNISLAPSSANDSFFDIENSKTIDTLGVPKDDFFDVYESTTAKNNIYQESAQASADEEYFQKQPILESTEKTTHYRYKPIPHIEQKLHNMYAQFPPAEENFEDFSLISDWLLHISIKGYSDEDIEAIFTKLKEQHNTNKAQAAQLLLLAGATESKFAQFMLARELYRGGLLKKNISESIARIYRLAMDDYPEALCDLAQFYEHGIGKEKDKEQALSLYKEAMDLGVQRAASHYERMKKEKKGFLGIFKSKDTAFML